MALKSSRLNERIYGLDALRAIMMLLGLIVHTVFSFSTIDWGNDWPYKDTYTTSVAEHTYFFIHSFRMPIFFVLAGFFTCMLYLKRGALGVASNRLQRIGIPLLIGLFVLYPLVTGGFVFSVSANEFTFKTGLKAFLNMPLTDLLIPTSTMHLWFIYYLLYFYLASLLIATLAGLLPLSWRNFVHLLFKGTIRHPIFHVILPAIVTTIALISTQGVNPVSTLFKPDIDSIVVYGIYFGFGWLLFLHREEIFRFKHSAWLHVLLGITAYFVSEFFIRPNIPAGSEDINLIITRSVTGGIVVWLLFYGFMGLFLRYLNKPSALIRYIVDASYWIYLIHLPCAIWLPGILSNTSLTLWPRMFIVFITITMIGFFTYDLFVRSTVIGKILNGRRYQRGLPDKKTITIKENLSKFQIEYPQSKL